MTRASKISFSLIAGGWLNGWRRRRERGGKRELVLRGRLVRGATPLPTWLSRSDTPHESPRICAPAPRLLPRKRSDSRERKNHVSRTGSGENSAPTRHSRMRESAAANVAKTKYSRRTKRVLSDKVRLLCVRVAWYMCACVCVGVYPHILVRTIASVFRDACLHRRSIKR